MAWDAACLVLLGPPSARVVTKPVRPNAGRQMSDAKKGVGNQFFIPKVSVYANGNSFKDWRFTLFA